MNWLNCGSVYLSFTSPIVLASRKGKVRCFSGFCEYVASLQVTGPHGICDPYREILIECSEKYLSIYIFDDEEFRHKLYKKYRRDLPIEVNLNGILSSYISKLSEFFSDILS